MKLLVKKHDNIVSRYVDKDFYGNNIKDGDILTKQQAIELIELTASRLYCESEENIMNDYIKSMLEELEELNKINMGDYDFIKE